jgi:Mce-associated membrane protein
MNRLRLLAVGAVLVALALAAFAGLQAHRAAATADARADALAAAQTRVPDLLSYDKATLDDDLGRALDQTTGSFTDDYEQILTDVVEPTAQRRGISTHASISAAGVVSGDRNEVVVLLFLTQTTTAKGDRSSVSGSRVEVTMERSGDDWKIAGLKPV